MNIRVTPRDCLNLDLSKAVDGDLLIVELQKSPPLILTSQGHNGMQRLVLAPEHMPLQCRDHIRDEMRHILSSDAFGLGQWFETYNVNDRHPYDLLYDALSMPCLPSRFQIGSKLVFHLNDPFDGMVAYSPSDWVVGPVVTNFSPATRGLGEVEKVRVILES